MHSNFITPPDFIRTVLIVNATTEQVEAVAEKIREKDVPYNIYLYSMNMEQPNWLVEVAWTAHAILVCEDTGILRGVPHTTFGPQSEFKNPVDYFTK